MIWWPQSCCTYGSKVTHICISNLTIITPDNGLSPGECHFRKVEILSQPQCVNLLWILWATKAKHSSIQQSMSIGDNSLDVPLLRNLARIVSINTSYSQRAVYKHDSEVNLDQNTAGAHADKCFPDSKVHGANMGPIWGHVAIWVANHVLQNFTSKAYMSALLPPTVILIFNSYHSSGMIFSASEE